MQLSNALSILVSILTINCSFGMTNKDVCIVPEISGGTVHVFVGDNDFSPVTTGVLLPPGSEIMVTCNDGYDAALNELIDENFSLRCSRGQFPSLPSCIPIPSAVHEAEMSKEEYDDFDPETKILSVRKGSKGARKHHRTKPCSYEPKDEMVLVHHNETLIKYNGSFPNGTILTYRCKNISSFSFSGNSTRLCVNQKWVGKQPRCTRLYQRNFYSAPVVTYAVENGDEVIREDGVLLAPERSNIVLTCLWLRENSEPHWKKNGFDIKIPQKSATKIKWNKMDDAFELHIPMLKFENSGYYVCNTPNRKMHGIHLLVTPKVLTENFVVTNDTQYNETLVSEPATTTCQYSPIVTSGIYAFNGTKIVNQNESFDSGTMLSLRCQDIFQFSFEGNKSNECIDGQWAREWPKCIRLKADSSDSSPPLEVQVTPPDKEYTITNGGQLIIPKDTTVTFICKYSTSKPILALHGTKLRFSTGFSRSGTVSGWYLRTDLPSHSIRFRFVCKIPRKDIDLSHSLDVIAQNMCKLEEKKPLQKWRLSHVVNLTKNIYEEDEMVELQCSGLTATVIPSYLKCGDKGNWLQGPNQKCKTNAT